MSPWPSQPELHNRRFIIGTGNTGTTSSCFQLRFWFTDKLGHLDLRGNRGVNEPLGTDAAGTEKLHAERTITLISRRETASVYMKLRINLLGSPANGYPTVNI
jgi:hypothetical protein